MCLAGVDGARDLGQGGLGPGHRADPVDLVPALE